MPDEGFVVTTLLIVSDVGRSRRFYADVLGARVLTEGPPAMLKLQNSWLIINEGGGPTDDKPDIEARAPADRNVLTQSLNLRVADIAALYERWKAAGAHFLTEPKHHPGEIRCYMRDPDGYLIEVGQTTKKPE